MSLADLLYSVTAGPEGRRRLLTPVGLAVAITFLLLVIVGGCITDRALGLPRLLPGRPGMAIGMLLLVGGLSLHAWCLVLFKKARGGGGIGVPFNPPRELVVAGPYAWVRNPMLTALFAWLSGIGFILHSVSTVLVWVPAFVVLNVVELKLVEEPELERRLGPSYKNYKETVPMFVPKRPASREGERAATRR